MSSPSPFPPIFSIGHWSHEPESFLALLKLHSVTRLVDVRSSPGSRFNPQYNQDNLKQLVESAGIEYVHRKLLGGREKGGDVSLRLQIDPSVSECLLKAVDRDDLLTPTISSSTNSASTNCNSDRNEYDDGWTTTTTNMKKTPPSPPATCALMCSEANWHECHRQNLVHYLVTKFESRTKSVRCFHIWPDGKLEEHTSGSKVCLTQKDAETARALETAMKGTCSASFSAAPSTAAVRTSSDNNDEDDGDHQHVQQIQIETSSISVPLPASKAAANHSIHKKAQQQQKKSRLQ